MPPKGTAGATEIPLLGLVAAGAPIEAVVHGESIQVPDQMLPRRGPNYALKVRGDSMVDDHILDGDFVVVHGRQTAENGEMVIALMNGAEATVKRFYREKAGMVRLQPASDEMAPILARASEVEIRGVVVAVMRKYSVGRKRAAA
jgi:repressor LexA